MKIWRDRIHHFHRRISSAILRDTVLLRAEFRHCAQPVSFESRLEGVYQPIEEGGVWGHTWESAWFHLTGKVPQHWAGLTVSAQLDFNGEGAVFKPDGGILQGITNGSIFDPVFIRDIVQLLKSARGGETVDLWVETAANGLFGVLRTPDLPLGDSKRYGFYAAKVNRMRLCVVDHTMRALQQDLQVLRELLKVLPPNGVRYARILRCLSRAADVFGDNPANAERCRDMLKQELLMPAEASALTAYAVGHAHIDTGWLWPVRETIRKCGRTFANQLRLIERYPGYVFGASQPQHYVFVKTHYPELYEQVRARVADGRWECQGAMWVEADCNIISGESMVRQILHGKNFFRDEFSVEVKNVWLPDVFGYSASMPQMLRKAGIEFFVTQKISWNQVNQFPHTTFKWRGIDGSEVITHFPPEGNYNSPLGPETLCRGAEKFQEKGYIPGFLSLFGIGDGGGGPHEEHIERGLRQANLEGSPKVQFGHAQQFLDTLPAYSDEMPVWSGELYLEIHRGTLTTQARTKRNNRLLENRLRQVEYLCSLGRLADYPQAELDRIWKRVMINQFHDIIPGSSIRLVYEQTEREHGECLAECDQLIRQSASGLFDPDCQSLVLVNVLSYDYQRPVVLPESWNDCSIRMDGTELAVQIEKGRPVVLVSIPAHGSVTLTKQAAVLPAERPQNNALILENDLVSYEFAADGRLTAAWDKECNRAILASGGFGNVFTMYVDLPNQYDAWDIDDGYANMVLEHAAACSVRCVADGSVRRSLHFDLTIGKSTISQTVHLAKNSKRLDFETSVDWRETHHMLRTAFAVNVMSDRATCDIQYGYVERPTHRNTSWDAAKFEVTAQRYVDLSGNDYGVALLNDCKYGHKLHDKVIDLNLLRSPTDPDPDADQGMHLLTYSLLPHAGRMIDSTVQAEAAQLNMPPVCLDAFRDSGRCRLPVRISGAGVSLEVVKKAEKESSLILRLVETRGCRGFCEISPVEGGTVLVETDLMEWNDEVPAALAAPVQIAFNPFEIKTFKLRR
ncbi:MAG: glycosyl hydrolase-related protein [Pontiellaceae bacterium]|nr:glycosyl hydrolase-related protein [Pontiellaceae bacterium]